MKQLERKIRMQFEGIRTVLRHIDLYVLTSSKGRAGLKPMQPMQLHWAPRLWGPAPWCLSRLFIFSKYSLRSRIQYKWLINLIVNKQRSR